MTERLTVEQFAARYTAAKTKAEKNKVVDSVITRTYVPFMEKVTSVQILLESAFDDRDGLKIPNEFCIHLNFQLLILTLYTNLEITQEKSTDGENSDLDDKTALSRAYDVLQSCDLWTVLIERIGIDYYELLNIKEMYLKNISVENEMTVQFAKQISRFGNLIGSAFKPLADQLLGEVDQLNAADKAELKSLLFELVK